jgi:hypothetical protein
MNMSDGEVLKWEVFKVDFEMLRYFSMYENYLNCFEEDFDSDYFKMSPEKAFLSSSEYWLSLNDSKLWEEVVCSWSIQTIYEYWFCCKDRYKIKRLVDEKRNKKHLI